MRKELVITAHGHPNVKATHKSTLELTKDAHLTPRGDCIIGVEADYSVYDLPDSLKRFIKAGNKVLFKIIVGENVVEGFFYGSPKLTLEHKNDIVIRKSEYTCSRTLGIRSSLVAKDLPDKMREELKNSETIVKLVLIYEE